MKTAVYGGPGRLLIEDRPEPALQADDDVILSVEACGICGSDLQLLSEPPAQSGDVGTVLGHELVGRVRAAGAAAREFQIGQRVVVNPDPRCGRCPACASGKPFPCAESVAIGGNRDGGFASSVRVPSWSLHPIADHVPAHVAILAEPLACVMSALHRLSDLRDTKVAVVIGGGTIGCLFVALLKAARVDHVIVIERSGIRGETARAVGADVVLTSEAFAERRAELVGHGADVVIDAGGNSMSLGVETARSGGCLLLFGINQLAVANIRQSEITFKSLTVLGHASFLMGATFPAAIEFLETGTVDLSPLISATVNVSGIRDGIARLRAGHATKVVVVP